MVKRPYSGSEDENPSKKLYFETESMEDVNKDNNRVKNVRSFYSSKSSNTRSSSQSWPSCISQNGGKEESLKRITPTKQQQQQHGQNSNNPTSDTKAVAVKLDQTDNISNEGGKSPCPPPAVKRFYKHDIFWTSNIYGKKKRTAQTKPTGPFSKLDGSSNTNNEESVKSVSIETQTSFSSSQDSSIGTSSPAMSATSSPFVTAGSSGFKSPCGTSPDIEMFSQISPDIGLSLQTPDREQVSSKTSSGDEKIETIFEVDNGREEEFYEMFNCDSTTPCNKLNESDSSFSVSPSKRTPKKNQKKTLFNYFSKVSQNDKKSGCSKNNNENQGRFTERLQKRNSRQMQFSKTGLSPQVEIGYFDVVYIK